jgi:uncharacterized membrane protein AbrB (regulator of aidB expression)
MFILLPWLLRHGNSFWLSLGASCLLTVCLYLLTIWLLSRFGIHI